MILMPAFATAICQYSLVEEVRHGRFVVCLVHPESHTQNLGRSLAPFKTCIAWLNAYEAILEIASFVGTLARFSRVDVFRWS